MLTTPAPVLDVIRDFPELADQARSSVRLHPRVAADGAVGASKMAGMFYWPHAEPWPCHDESWVNWDRLATLHEDEIESIPRLPARTSIPFAPILQLRAQEFPRMPFPPGAEMFQLLWFPYPMRIDWDSDWSSSSPSLDHRVIWRKTNDQDAIRATNTRMIRRPGGLFAPICRLEPEPVFEYPISCQLDSSLVRQYRRLGGSPPGSSLGNQPDRNVRPRMQRLSVLEGWGVCELAGTSRDPHLRLRPGDGFSPDVDVVRVALRDLAALATDRGVRGLAQLGRSRPASRTLRIGRLLSFRLSKLSTIPHQSRRFVVKFRERNLRISGEHFSFVIGGNSARFRSVESLDALDGSVDSFYIVGSSA